MDWILGHLNLVLVVAALVASWVANRSKQNNRRNASRPSLGETSRRDSQTRSPLGPSELSEEARRVQEEIRRRIAERTATRMPSAPSPRVPVVVPPPPPPELPPTRTEVTRGELMQAELARLVEERRQRVEKREAAAAAQAAEEDGGSFETNTTIGDLRNPENLRRAIVLNEILGKPVALR